MIPLGGTGEIGKNMYVVETAGRMVVIDCGVTFPKQDQLGVDLVLPDFDYVVRGRDRLDALILTHGHEDHIGAVPYLLRAVGPVPIYGRPFTLALVRAKLDEHRLSGIELNTVEYGPTIPIGPFGVQYIPLTHSIPDCAAIVLRSPAGTVVHTGDFRFDHQPISGTPRTDIPALARLGDEGVRLLLADSTNADQTEPVRPESTVGEELARVFARAPGRVIVTTFSSHIHRVQQVLNAAYEDGRVVSLVGRSLSRNTNIAIQLGYMSTPPGVVVKPRELEAHRPDEQVVMCTGSQGEHMAALSRIARGEHPQIQIQPDDTIIYSSSTVPGNELAVNETINRLRRLKARVITESDISGVHASGHGTAGDLLLMLQLLRPTYFAPIHGESRHQLAHADLAASVDVPLANSFVMDNGDVLQVDRRGAAIIDRVQAGRVYVDGLGVGDVAETVLRDRRHLADDGLVLVIARVDANDGSPVGEAEIITRGFGPGEDLQLLEETRLAIERSLAGSSTKRVTEVGVLQHQLHDAVASLLKKRTQQRPMVLPVIVEV